MSERLTIKKIAAPLIVGGIGIAALAGCGNKAETIVEAPTSTTTTTTNPNYELYPIETGRKDRSEVIKKVHLPDGMIITCLETHTLEPGVNRGSDPQYEVAEACEFGSTTTTTSQPQR